MSSINIEEPQSIITSFKLYENYPNPFNPITHISFDVPKSSQVNLSIYEITGRLVKTLINNEMHPGKHTTTFEAGDLSSGIYFYRLQANSYIEVKRMMLIK